MQRRFFLLAAIVALLPAMAVATTAELYKRPNCGCCVAYADYLRTNGLAVTVVPTRRLAVVRRVHGVPSDYAGCHTTVIGDYVFEGHIPFVSIRHVLTTQPDINGLAVRGMPVGTPGMPGELDAPVKVWALGVDGAQVFTTYRKKRW